MKTHAFFYHLPEELIAQTPLDERSRSRLLRVGAGGLEEYRFDELTRLLRPGDCLVLNDTKVIPARLFGRKAGGGAAVEILLLRRLGLKEWRALLRPGKKLRPGTRIEIMPDRLSAVAGESLGEGERLLRFEFEGVWESLLDEVGQMPLPPYIRERLADPTRYQTVYARASGSAAAPTAGLHFTQALLERLRGMGVSICFLTLHVGLGTFRPVKEEELEAHPMHEEYYELGAAEADAINAARAAGGRVVAVGTTSCRVLESLADARGRVAAASGWTRIFIYPGYRFKAIDALITNFHLPESTLIMLVSAFVGHSRCMAAYRHAVEARFRFFSFGDAMFVERNPRPDLPPPEPDAPPAEPAAGRAEAEAAAAPTPGTERLTGRAPR